MFVAEEQAILSIFMSIYAVKFKLILRLIYRYDVKKAGRLLQGHTLLYQLQCHQLGLYYFFPTNHTTCLAEGALPTVLVDIYFSLEIFKQQVFW